MTLLKDLSREELEALLTVSNMNEGDIKEHMKSIRTRDKEDAVILMHTIFCTQEHDGNSCQFYSESNYSECWDMPSHKVWLDYTNKVIEDLDIKSSKELSRQLTLLMKGLENMVSIEYVNIGLIKNWISTREERHELNKAKRK